MRCRRADGASVVGERQRVVRRGTDDRARVPVRQPRPRPAAVAQGRAPGAAGRVDAETESRDVVGRRAVRLRGDARPRLGQLSADRRLRHRSALTRLTTGELPQQDARIFESLKTIPGSSSMRFRNFVPPKVYLRKLRNQVSGNYHLQQKRTSLCCG